MCSLNPNFGKILEKLMKKNLLLTLGLVTTMAAVGCTDASTDGPVSPSSGEYGSRGLALTTDFLGNTDVVGMRYEISKCGDGLVHTADRKLEDLLLPGMIPAFENKPFDEDSQHIFADNFVVLPAGCYDVKITPLKANGDASSDCASASAEDVMVVDQLTTEILMVSQCKGPERGALDVVGALNHPPIIEVLNYHPSKFITCGEGKEYPHVVLCAKASDPDSDPLEFEWKQVGGDPVVYGPKVIKHEVENGWEEQCVKVKLPYGSAGYEFELTVYDMFHSDAVPVQSGGNNGNSLIRAELWFQLNGYGDVYSRAKLRFPLYVSCDDPCYEPNGTFIGGDNEECVEHCYDMQGNRTECLEDHCYDENRHEIECEEYCYDKQGNKSECYDDRCYDDNRHEIDCEVELTCPHSQGYWKNHNKYAKNPSQKIPWPISEDTNLCGKTWLNILKTPAGGDAFYILAYQYIAARLNLANGGPTSPTLLAKVAEAGDLLNQCKKMKYPSADRTKAVNLGSYLEKYNTNKLLDCGKQDDWCKNN